MAENTARRRVVDPVPLDPNTSSSTTTDSSARTGMRKHILNFYKTHLSVELDNTRGSVARDHLANERTYLAWLRTSLSFASAGVGVTQLLRLNTLDDHNRNNERVGRLRKLGKPAGAALILLALIVICFGNIRYFTAQAAMQKGKFPASRMLVAILSLATLFVLIAGLFVLLVLNPASAV